MNEHGPSEEATLRRRVRVWLALFIVGLVLSGLTAFPLLWELNLLVSWLQWPPLAGAASDVGLTAWIVRVRDALAEQSMRYPFMAYGTDWLAFAHLVIASAFYGPWRDPVRNVWIIEWAMLACVAVIPLAMICGPLRGIPFGWRLIDCAFGVFGIVPLLLVRRDIKRLEQLSAR